MMQPVNSNHCFNESQWMKVVFLLADTQCWLDEMNKDLFAAVPVSNQRKYLRKTYFLTPAALAHILERHYYKINRHPEAGKFHVSLPCLLELIRDASAMEAYPMKGCRNYYRVLHTDSMIGFDKDGREERRMTVITDAGGRIVTVFPGILEEVQHREEEEKSCMEGN